jgi:preprotein translocase subunit SecE
VARNRQRAKQRQAERRARRLQEEGRSDGSPQPRAAEPAAPPEPPVERAPEPPAQPEREPEPPARRAVPPPEAVPIDPILGANPNLVAGAPPQDEGYPHVEADEEWYDEDHEHLTEEEFEEAEDEEDRERAGTGEAGYAVRGRRGRERHEPHRDRPRVIQFLIAVWAELKRVQWPNRQALTTLTGVVLGFVLIMGGYLGLLDAIFSKLIQAIL